MSGPLTNFRRGVRALSRTPLVALALLAASTAAPALAQSDAERAGARAAATAGGKAFTEGRWEEAVDLFTRAESTVHSPVQLLYLARSYEKLGLLVKAREVYLKITNEELPQIAPEPWRDAKVDAQKELDALEPRLPSVRLDVQGSSRNAVTVTVDGVTMSPAFFGIPQPIDPGKHRFVASGRGFAPVAVEREMKEGALQTVLLSVRPSGSAFSGGSDLSRSTGPPTLAWVALGVGGAGLVLGLTAGLVAGGKHSTLASECGASTCAPQYSGALDSFRTWRTVSTVGYVVGTLGVATGAVLWLTSPRTRNETALWLGPASAGVAGRF